MRMLDHSTLINQTQKWLETVIIGQGFCPFAKREHDLSRIHYAVISAADVQSQLACLILECAALDKYIKRETSLLIFPTALSDFESYLDLLEMATALLKTQGYEGIYQLASFHPKYRFEGAPHDDPANYTNRSPYPMLHILRESSVELAVKNHPNPENIPDRNIALTQALGLQAMTKLLASCFRL